MNWLNEILSGPATTGDVIVLLAALAGFLSVVGVWAALLEPDRATTRARMLARRRAELQEGQGGRRTEGRRLQLSSRELVTWMVRQLRLAQDSRAEKIRDRLQAAGFRSREAVYFYLVAKLLLPFGAGAGATMAIVVLDLGHLQGGMRIVVLCLSAIIGFYLPEIYLSNRIQKRMASLQKSLPDALDLLVICAEAGLALGPALHRVAEEIARSAPELADELALTSIELGFLPDRKQALTNLAKRVPLPMMQATTSTLIQTERYGTPLAPSLRVLSAELREQRLIKAEEKAAKLPATLTVPLIVFILPALFVVLAGPAMLGVYDNLLSK